MWPILVIIAIGLLGIGLFACIISNVEDFKCLS
jgi:hypothetical protein